MNIYIYVLTHPHRWTGRHLFFLSVFHSHFQNGSFYLLSNHFKGVTTDVLLEESANIFTFPWLSFCSPHS